MRRFSCILSLLLLLAACKPTVPRHIIQPDDMESFLYDYYLAKATAMQTGQGNSDRDYRQHQFVEAVFQKHHITHAEFDSSIVYYYAHADRLEEMYKRVGDRLEKKALSMGAGEGEFVKYVTLSDGGDTTNIWTGRTHALLSPQPPRNRFDFEIEADTTTRSGDIFLLQFVSDYLFQSGVKDGVAVLNVYFAEDTVISRSTHYSSSGFNKLRVETPSGLTPTRINGFFYIGGGEEKTTVLRLLFLNSIQLIRFHQQQKDDEKDDAAPATKDSIAPIADDRRPDVEAPGRGDSLRPGAALLRVVRGDSIHRMDERHH
ncbi:MAG: DUF4296 domain-containing protein [Prevotella sp.]|nr:DUF4296 domain-containing protein [Prevotella sp.]